VGYELYGQDYGVYSGEHGTLFRIEIRLKKFEVCFWVGASMLHMSQKICSPGGADPSVMSFSAAIHPN
jgi:hypothetical protein